jgi:hypothetical protein
MKKGNGISAAAFSLASLRPFLFLWFGHIVLSRLSLNSLLDSAATIEAPCSPPAADYEECARPVESRLRRVRVAEFYRASWSIFTRQLSP